MVVELVITLNSSPLKVPLNTNSPPARPNDWDPYVGIEEEATKRFGEPFFWYTFWTFVAYMEAPG